MANEKFSDFTVKTDLTDFTGLVGFETNTANYYITTSNFYDALEANLDLTDFTTGIGGAGEVLTVNGTGTGLEWSAPASGGVSSISFGTTGLTPNTATSGVVAVTGTLAVGHGGTGQTSYTIGDILYADTASTLAKLPASATSGHVLTSNGTGAAPSYQAVSGSGTVYGSFQGVMINPGDTVSTAKPQLIFNDPLASTSQAGFQIVPFDCEIETITMKWNGDTAPTIQIADGTTSWKIGKLTSNTGNADTSIGTVNFTDLTPTLAGAGGFEDLEISANNGDSGTFIYKQWNGDSGEPTNVPIPLSAGDILVFIIIRGTGDWSPKSDEITVNFKYKLT